MPSFKLHGRVYKLFDQVQVNPALVKQELILGVARGPSLGAEISPERIKIEFTQENVGLLDRVSVGDEITVHFHILGVEWLRNGQASYFVNLNGWRIEMDGDAWHTLQNDDFLEEPGYPQYPQNIIEGDPPF